MSGRQQRVMVQPIVSVICIVTEIRPVDISP
jgi:hypothetical protein